MSYCFFQEKRILLLFNDKESSKKSGCYLFNLSLYNYTDPLEIRPEECEKIILHDFQSYPASLDGNILVDRMMGQIAVTTNNVIYKNNKKLEQNLCTSTIRTGWKDSG